MVMQSQVISKQRVTDHGEVLTGMREVNAMLDLVKQETERIDSRFLEPACGTGNFLVTILERKLAVVESRYGQSQLEFERYAVMAIASLYGIEILPDNVATCRERLFTTFDELYERLFGELAKASCRATVRFIINRNIIWGDALTYKTIEPQEQPIIFSEWGFIKNLVKRRDFSFKGLVQHEATREALLFPEQMKGMEQMGLFADLPEDSYAPQPVGERAPIHFLELGAANEH